MSRYPAAEWVPWKWNPAAPAFYKGLNEPVAVVLHRMQGHKSTARMWAQQGYTGASWHFTVGLDGSVMQHLEFEDGGYHAGIPGSAPVPVWPLWRGRGENVNHYTVGVECEGFAGGEWPAAQLAALRALCRWLAGALGISPTDPDRFPPHAAIDVVNRVNDFDTPERRDTIVYPYLFEEEDMADPRFDVLNEALQKRMAITVVANNPDLPTVERAYAVLKDAGLVR